MEQLSWLFLFSMITLITLRWLLAWSLSPRNHHTIRYLFLQRLLAAYPEAMLLMEDEERITARMGEHTCVFRLDALYRRCREFPYRAEQFMQEIVQTVQHALQDSAGLPADWQQQITALLLRADANPPAEILQRSIVGALAMGYVVEVGDAFRWITQQDLEASGVSAEEVHTFAMRNLERSCNMLVIETLPQFPDGDEQVLRFNTGDGLDAARLLVPSLYQRFTGRFGDEDLLVGIPTRDTLIMVAVPDHSHASLLAWRAGTDYSARAYPLLDTLVRVTADGLESWHVTEREEM